MAKDAGNSQARTLLGLSYYGEKNFTQASAYLAPAAELDPSNAELNQFLAQSCLWAKKYDCALAAVRRVLTSRPESGAAHMLIGEALDGLSRTQDAVKEFEAAARLSPNEPNVHFGLGYLYWKSHQFDAAQREFQNELALEAKHAQAIAYLGDIAMKKGDPARAVVLLKHAVQIDPGLRFAYVELGRIYSRQSDYADALAAYRYAIKLDPSQPDGHYGAARVYQRMGKKAESDREFAIVVEQHQREDDRLMTKMPLPSTPQ
jgi:tetratricopeptide (TPR) repeat protein